MAGARKASILNRVKLADFQSSTKIEALREELHRMLQADPSAKALVFSQFTSMLDLIYFRLQQVRPEGERIGRFSIFVVAGEQRAGERGSPGTCCVPLISNEAGLMYLLQDR